MELKDFKISSKLPGINCKESSNTILKSFNSKVKDKIVLSFDTGVILILLLVIKALTIKTESNLPRLWA